MVARRKDDFKSDAYRSKPSGYELKRMLHSHRCNCSGKSILQRYLPYVQYGAPHLLSEDQRTSLWEQVGIIVRRTERRHFGLIRQPERNHEDRILAFYELAEARYDESPAWIVTAFQEGFSEIEALLQMRRMGISLQEYDRKTGKPLVTYPILQYKRWYCRLFVDYFIIKRRQEIDKDYTYHKYYASKNDGKYPSRKTARVWQIRVQVLEHLISMSTEMTYGFRRALSLDELLVEVENEGGIFEDKPDV